MEVAPQVKRTSCSCGMPTGPSAVTTTLPAGVSWLPLQTESSGAT
jgi:hypothetical protein